MSYSHLYKIIEELVLTQFPRPKGLKGFGELGTEAVVDELEQLVIQQSKVESLSKQEKVEP